MLRKLDFLMEQNNDDNYLFLSNECYRRISRGNVKDRYVDNLRGDLRRVLVAA